MLAITVTAAFSYFQMNTVTDACLLLIIVELLRLPRRPPRSLAFSHFIDYLLSEQLPAHLYDAPAFAPLTSAERPLMRDFSELAFKAFTRAR